jgi:L-xylulokinase
VIAGNWSINEYISKTPVLNKSAMMNSLYCMDGYYLIEECSPTSAGNQAWFIDRFMTEEKLKSKELGISVYQLCDDLADTIQPQDQNIVFLPYIYGSNYNLQAKATLVGMDSHHTRAQIFSDVFNLPIDIIEATELGALGCAMASAVAAGEYEDLKAAAESMVKIKCRMEPKAANISIYEDKYALYKKVSKSLENVWKEFA